MNSTRYTRERFLLLHELRLQLPRTRGLRGHTERAIAQLERELAGGRDAAGWAATEREQMVISGARR